MLHLGPLHQEFGQSTVGTASHGSTGGAGGRSHPRCLQSHVLVVSLLAQTSVGHLVCCISR